MLSTEMLPRLQPLALHPYARLSRHRALVCSRPTLLSFFVELFAYLVCSSLYPSDPVLSFCLLRVRSKWRAIDDVLKSSCVDFANGLPAGFGPAPIGEDFAVGAFRSWWRASDNLTQFAGSALAGALPIMGILPLPMFASNVSTSSGFSLLISEYQLGRCLSISCVVSSTPSARACTRRSVCLPRDAVLSINDYVLDQRSPTSHPQGSEPRSFGFGQGFVDPDMPDRTRFVALVQIASRL